MHQYRIQYQSFLNVWNLKEVAAKSELPPGEFVNSLIEYGYWIDGRTWLSPGCIQQVLVIS